jgi:hypothetical protein
MDDDVFSTLAARCISRVRLHGLAHSNELLGNGVQSIWPPGRYSLVTFEKQTTVETLSVQVSWCSADKTRMTISYRWTKDYYCQRLQSAVFIFTQSNCVQNVKWNRSILSNLDTFHIAQSYVIYGFLHMSNKYSYVRTFSLYMACKMTFWMHNGANCTSINTNIEGQARALSNMQLSLFHPQCTDLIIGYTILWLTIF